MTVTRIAVAGDWHGNTAWALNVIPRIGQVAPSVRTVIQLGDFNIGVGRWAKGFLNLVDSLLRGQGIEELLIVPGNHDHQARINSLAAIQRGERAQLTERVFVAPRPYRFKLYGRSCLAMPGAASLDTHDRVEGLNWWPEEVGSAEEFAEAAEGGHADIMFTHEAVDGATAATAGIAAGRNPYHWPADRLAASAESRRRTTELWNDVNPNLLFHGHLHQRAEATLADGRRVYSLDCDARRGNFGILDLATDDWTWH